MEAAQRGVESFGGSDSQTFWMADWFTVDYML